MRLKNEVVQWEQISFLDMIRIIRKNKSIVLNNTFPWVNSPPGCKVTEILLFADGLLLAVTNEPEFYTSKRKLEYD